MTGYLKGVSAPIDLLWQDDRLLAVNKLLVHGVIWPPRWAEILADLASAWLEQMWANCPMRAYPVKLVDRGTSGGKLATSSAMPACWDGR